MTYPGAMKYASTLHTDVDKGIVVVRDNAGLWTWEVKAGTSVLCVGTDCATEAEAWAQAERTWQMLHDAHVLG